MSKLCSPKEIREIAGYGDGVFVLFYASWCPFSLAFLPVYEKHAQGRDREFVSSRTARSPAGSTGSPWPGSRKNS